MDLIEVRNLLASNPLLDLVDEVRLTNGLRIRFLPPASFSDLTWSSLIECVYRAARELEAKRMTVDHVTFELEDGQYVATAYPPSRFDLGLAVVVRFGRRK